MGPCRWNRRIGLFAPDRGCIHTMPSAEPSSQHLLSGRPVAREPWLARSESSRPSSSSHDSSRLRQTPHEVHRSQSVTPLRSAVSDLLVVHVVTASPCEGEWRPSVHPANRQNDWSFPDRQPYLTAASALS